MCAASTTHPAQQLTGFELLQLAQDLLTVGEQEKAQKLYMALQNNRHKEIRLEASFQLGLLSITTQKYRAAVGYFQQILNSYPALARVRLELARAYFLLEGFTESRKQFELVKGDENIPESVIATVDGYLEAIRRQKNWSFDFSLGLEPDSNLNQASGNTEECIISMFGLLCRSVEPEDSGIGLTVNATANYYYKLSDSMSLLNTAGLYATEYSNDKYDDYIMYLASGPRYIFDGGELSLQPNYTRRWVGHSEYSESFGLRFDIQKDIDRFILGGGIAASKHSYHDDAIDAALHGEKYNFNLNGRYILGPRSFVQGKLEYIHDLTKNDIYASDTWRPGIAVFNILPYGLSTYLSASAGIVHYRAEQYYVRKDYFLGLKERKDREYDITAELRSSRWEHLGIRPTLQYNYFKRTSNIHSYAYDRHRVNLNVTVHF